MSNATNNAARTIAQTWIPRYRIAALTGALDMQTEDLTFYEACKTLTVARERNLCGDATHIRRGSRCVAFWSDWEHKIVAMFGARDDERDNVRDLFS
jgi:hypothetical protein